MTDYDALYAAVLDRPEDDTPRLVLADWLADHGDPVRAEFVRTQVELARMPRLVPANVLCHQVEWEHFAGRLSDSAGAVRFDPPPPGSLSGVGVLHYERLNPERKALEDRAKAVFDRHRCEWFGERWAVLYHDGDQEDAEGIYPALTSAFASRGFIGEVWLPLAAFVGGECRGCDGRGGWGGFDGDDAATMCLDCSGTGRVPGLARELFTAHPLTKVVLTGREPASVARGFVWRADPGREHLLEAVPASLPLKWEYRSPAGNYLRSETYPTYGDALTALSDACIAYGRELAGLRPLTAPTS